MCNESNRLVCVQVREVQWGTRLVLTVAFTCNEQAAVQELLPDLLTGF